MITVRALEHCFNCNPGEEFGVTPEEYEAEMRRKKPRVVVVEQSLAAEVVPDDVEDEPTVDEKPNREARARRTRG